MGVLYQKNAYTATGTTVSVGLDPAICPFSATAAVTVGTTATYSLQYSLDPLDVADADALWFTSGDIPVGTTTSATSGFLTPIARVRLVIAAISGTVTLQTQQGFSIN